MSDSRGRDVHAHTIARIVREHGDMYRLLQTILNNAPAEVVSGAPMPHADQYAWSYAIAAEQIRALLPSILPPGKIDGGKVLPAGGG